MSLLGKTGEIRFNLADTFNRKSVDDYNTPKKCKRPHIFFFLFVSTLAGVFVMQEDPMSSDIISHGKDKADWYTAAPTHQQLQYLILHDKIYVS